MPVRAGGSAGGALLLHVAERTDVLVEGLADLLAAPGADTFAPEVVAVPTRGVERWVAQRLARRLGTAASGGAPGAGGPADGVCANVRFDPPRRLVADVLAAAGGTAAADDPWRADRLAWEVLAVLDASAGQPWLAPVARHLGADGDGTEGDEVRRGRRLRLAQRVTDLLVRYDEARPALVRAWADGADEDGAGEPVPPDLLWQPRLWRAVRSRLGTPAPAERLVGALRRLADEPGLVNLPPRLSVLGATALPEAHLDVLGALARHREVHLWLPHPSLALWERTARTPVGLPLRRADRVRPARHRLLAAMAGDVDELALRLLARPVAVRTLPTPAPAPTVLGALRAAVSEDRRGGPRHRAAADDRTVQVHACHGRARQVEVLREVLVGLLADDPTLEPRDVVVMCPDVEAFAPLVEAAFGAPGRPAGAPSPAVPGGGPAADAGTAGAPEHPGRRLRVRIADRAPARANPLLAVVATLLELAGSRVPASAVVDLAGRPPVRRRFGLGDADLDRVRAWAVEAGARWGEDAHRRARFGLGRVPQGTFATALDRLLLGVAMAEEDQRFVGAVLPVDDVSSTDVDLVGRLAELLDRLTATLADLAGVRPASAWFGTLERALALLTDVPAADRWQAEEAARVLAEARAAAEAGGDPDLRLPDVVAALEPWLRARPTRSGFRTGALTVCSLAPMRAVPHRVVALLGLDDGAFPRTGATDGDDLLARGPLVGERDRRQEDRQLFLDAVTSAQEHLVVVHAGADERTGARRPPAVPVGELLDALDDAVAWPDGRTARERVVQHPLQTVDERNFVPGALGRPGPFSADAVDLAAARRARGPRTPAPPFLPAPLPPLPAGDVDLEDLVAVLEHPVRALVRTRLGVVPPRDEAQLEDRLPLALDGLQTWSIGDRLLRAALAGADLDRAVAAERRRGHAPPGELGGATMREVRATVEPVLAAAAAALAVPARTRDVDVPLPGGRRLTGTVEGLRGDELVTVVYSRLAAKHRLRAWVRLLALAADSPERPLAAATIGRGEGTTNRQARLEAPAPEVARRMLAGLVALHDRALREVLPLPLAAACAYARARSGPDASEADGLAAARKELGTPELLARHAGGFELDDAYHRAVWGPGFAFDDLLLDLPGDVDRAAAPHEGTRFGALAVALLGDLLAHETVTVLR